MSFFSAMCKPGSKAGGKLKGDELDGSARPKVIPSQADIDREAALQPAADIASASASASDVKPAVYRMPGLTDRTTREAPSASAMTPDEWRAAFVQETAPWKHGLEELGITPRIFKIDLLSNKDEEPAAYRAQMLDQLAAMNGPTATFKQAYALDYKEQHDRFYTAFPLDVKPYSDASDLQRVRLEFGLPIESRTQEDVYDLVSKVNKLGQEFSHGNALYLYMDPAAVQTQLRESLGDFNDSRRYHAVVLSVGALDVSNNTDTTFRVRMETADMQWKAGKPRYSAMCDPIGVCALTDTQAHANRNGKASVDCQSAGQCALTLKARAEGAIHPALKTMYKISPQGIERIKSPDLLRWAQVDPRKARAEAEPMHFMKGPNLHIPVSVLEGTNEEDPYSTDHLFPKTIAEYIFYAHGYELRQACELLEERRLRGVQTDGIDPKEPILIPQIGNVGTTEQIPFWIVPYAAFEMVLDFYCNQACQSDSAVNLSVPLRLALTPASGNAGWGNMLRNHTRDVMQNSVRPVHLRVFVDVTYVRIVEGYKLTAEDKSFLLAPVHKNKLDSDRVANQIQNQAAADDVDDELPLVDGQPWSGHGLYAPSPWTGARASATGRYTTRR